MKLAAPWMQHPGTRAVMQAIDSAGYQVFFVGGCVRNGLMGRSVDDIDIATDARPETVMELAVRIGARPVPTGLAHGTVTVVASGKAHEVTTFRTDKKSFGRHAHVAFSTGIAADAGRRDFTINALYARADGTILDPTKQGLPDLSARRVRFIGQAEDRITQDYLRILRFFRFHAWCADPARRIDADGLAACAALTSGLEILSKERIGAEIKKLLSAPDPSQAVAAMEHSGVLTTVLPGTSARLLPVLVKRERHCRVPPEPIRRLASLAGPVPDDALRLSRAEATAWQRLSDGMTSETDAGELGYRHGFETARDILILRAAASEQPLSPDQLARARRGAGAICPIRAADLMPRLRGPALGAALAALEARWIASDFTLSRSDLLN
ncbi:MAG: CCA tRNA nucleotidyltransferase [Rhodobacteraceae bacterium]|nr:CCA tRNA nucleotidyltransferase [Paracoccaceae bacterium]